jgi:L-arabinose isomerase
MEELQSFHVAEGDQFGDLVSRDRIRSSEGIKIGLLTGALFEYWRMYPDTLKEKVEKDNQVVLDRLSQNHEIVYPGLVDTMDTADEAGRRFRDEKIDLLIVTERTYIPDVYIHQTLSYTPGVPLLLYSSQSHDKFNFKSNYEDSLRDSGMMSLVQLVAGFKKMKIYDHLEVVVGSIHDEEAYREIERYIEVVTIHKQLKHMTIGAIGNVFRGMFDFEFDKTMVKGMLGPEVVHIQVSNLLDHWKKLSPEDAEIKALIKKVKTKYQVDGLLDSNIMDAARVALALKKLVRRFNLDGLVLLGQHYVEAEFKTTSYLGMAELHEEGKTLSLTEGDVLGLIMMKILRHFTGRTPLFGEWCEYDVPRNAMMILGHGYADPTEAKKGTVPKVCASPEQWGLEGNGFSFEMTFDPGPVTIGHFICDAKGWRMLISGGEILDLPNMPIQEVTMFVKFERPIKEYIEILTKCGFPHHCIAVHGDVRKQLSQLADLMGMEKVFI